MMNPALTKNLKRGTVTIRYGYEQFLLSAKIKNYSPATIAYYERHIALFDKFHSLDNPITTITPELVQNYTLHLIEKDLREYSVFSYLKALRTVVNFFSQK